MATAKSETITVETVLVKHEQVVTLQLSPEEAFALYAVLQSVGGAPRDSSRKHADKITAALYENDRSLTVRYSRKFHATNNIKGSITFTDSLLDSL